MIGYLHGRVLSKAPEASQITVVTDALGYEVTVSKLLFERVQLSEVVTLWIHTHVREDILQLYGFDSETEKLLFRVLISVSGLGPRTALSLISQHGPNPLVQYIIQKDIGSISEAPGVGKKLAERIALELSSKMEKLSWAMELKTLHPTVATAPLSSERQLREDLTSALLNLGYPPNQVKGTLDRILDDESTLGFEGWLKTALKEMSGRPYG